MMGRAVALLAVAIAAASMSLAAPHAGAEHVAGASYTGTNSGGGAVDFFVSENGTEVHDFHYTVPVAVCSIGEQILTDSVPIVNHQFSFVAADFMSFSGVFPSPGLATGTIDPATIITGCERLTWTASATAVGGVAELPHVAGTPLGAGRPSNDGTGLLLRVAVGAAGIVSLSGAMRYAMRRHRAARGA